MTPSSLFLPVLVQIALTLALFLILGARKSKAIKSGGVDRRKAALDNGARPESVVKVSNNIANQFETPVLFYVLAWLLHATDNVTVEAIVLAWLYVASRLAHAFVHVSSNFVPVREGLMSSSPA